MPFMHNDFMMCSISSLLELGLYRRVRAVDSSVISQYCDTTNEFPKISYHFTSYVEF